MRYVVVDLQGNQRESFDSHAQLVAELADVVREDASAVRSLYVLEYDGDGAHGSSRRADEVLAKGSQGPSTVLVDFAHPSEAVHIGAADQSFRDFQAIVRATSARSGIAS